MTYSIVARDASTGELGVAVQSHSFGVGSVVPWVRAGVGAVATQAIAATSYASDLLEALTQNTAPGPALADAVARDPLGPLRQVGVVDSAGRAAAHTGDACIGYAGHAVGQGVVALGNLLAADRTWDVMHDAFTAAMGALPERLLTALDAAEAHGGDVRGRQSAALLVMAGERGDDPAQSAVLDVRVDDHPDPLCELRRLAARDQAWRQMIAAIDRGLRPDADPDAAIADLRDAQDAYGDSNLEPSMWAAVILAGAGRSAEADALVARVALLHPGCFVLFERLTEPGRLLR